LSVYVCVRLSKLLRTQVVEAPPPLRGAAAHLHLKEQTQKLCVFADPTRSDNFV